MIKAAKKKITVTEDDPSLQDVFKIMLEREGYETEILASGQSLINYKKDLPDLFILDKQLSGMDGVSLCKHLKTLKRTRSVPIIMISASPSIKQLSTEAGADDYIEKPFEMKTLLRKIKIQLRTKK